MIKLWSLKGYESELIDGHEDSVRGVVFVPNQGVMVSIDDGNEVAVWNLKGLDEEPVRLQVPVEETKRAPVSTLLYCPTFLSSEPKNHHSVFIAMSDASVYVLNWHLGHFSPVVIHYYQMFTNPKGDSISDMKCHPFKMHRLLVAFEETAVIVYSLNKDREI